MTTSELQLSAIKMLSGLDNRNAEIVEKIWIFINDLINGTKQAETRENVVKHQQNLSLEVADLMKLIEKTEPLPSDFDYKKEYSNYLIERYK